MATVNTHELKARIDRSPMSGTQIGAVALTFVLSALDGYDVLSVTFAAPAITTAWGIGKAALGVVLSAGLAGMALGAFFLAPLADSVGRKSMVLVSLVLMAIGMLASAFASTIGELSVWRVLTGLGIGGCAAIINPIAAEFANASYRSFTVAIMSIGYPVGGVLGGLLASVLLTVFSWQAVFLAGFFMAVLLLPIVLIFLPESLAYLLQRSTPDAERRLNQLLRKIGQEPVASMPEVGGSGRRGYRMVFSPDMLGSTIWLTAIHVIYVFNIYYILSWMPQMVADAGFDPASASLVSASANLAGVVGGLLLGWFARGERLRWLASIAVSSLGLASFAFGLTPPSFALLLLAGAVVGFFLFGGSTALYATLATTYPDEARASGTGFVTGTGRISSAIAPLFAGWLFAHGFGRPEVSLIFGSFSILAGLILVLGWRKYRGVA